MDNIAGQKSGLTIVTYISVIAIVIIWLIPTVGLFVSSFRDRDQISASGWWRAPFSVVLAEAGRADLESQKEENGVWVMKGNIFADPDVAERFKSGDSKITAFGSKGRAPGEFPVGTTQNIQADRTLMVEANGDYVMTSPKEITKRGPRIYTHPTELT